MGESCGGGGGGMWVFVRGSVCMFVGGGVSVCVGVCDGIYMNGHLWTREAFVYGI